MSETCLFGVPEAILNPIFLPSLSRWLFGPIFLPNSFPKWLPTQSKINQKVIPDESWLSVLIFHQSLLIFPANNDAVNASKWLKNQWFLYVFAYPTFSYLWDFYFRFLSKKCSALASKINEKLSSKLSKLVLFFGNYFSFILVPFWEAFGRPWGVSGTPKSRKIGKATRGKRRPFQKLLPIAQPGRVTRPGYLILISKTFILDLENRPGPAECAQRLNPPATWCERRDGPLVSIPPKTMP